MASSDAFALQRSDLNGFLFAGIGEEASGMTLSVLSALARAGLDPWQEAGRLARLPRAAAADALARIIAALPTGLWSRSDAPDIAARLVARLPARAGNAFAAAPAARTATRYSGHGVVLMALMVAMFAGLVANLAAQPGAASTHPAAAPSQAAEHVKALSR